MQNPSQESAPALFVLQGCLTDPNTSTHEFQIKGNQHKSDGDEQPGMY